MKFLKAHSLFLSILILTTVLRFLPLFEYQFTLDELSGLNRTRFDNFSELLEKGVKIDAHPALIQVLIYSLVKLFGYQTWIIKLPFLLFSLGAVIYAYALAYRHLHKQAALFVSAFLCFGLVYVFYAPIARMYTAGIFFSFALLFHFFNLLYNRQPGAIQYLAFGSYALLCALNQHINALFAFSVAVTGLFMIPPERRMAFILTCSLALMAYLPHLPITLYQVQVGGIGLDQGGWLEVPSWTILLPLLKWLLGSGYLYAVLILLLLFSVWSNGWPTLDKKSRMLLLLFLFNYLVVVAYSRWRAPVYQHSALLFAGTAFLLFTGSLLHFKEVKSFLIGWTTLCLLLLYHTYIHKAYFNQCVETVFEYPFERTAQLAKGEGNKTVSAVFFDADAFMESIYRPDEEKKYGLVLSEDSVAQKPGAYVRYLSGNKSDILVLASAFPQQEEQALVFYPYIIENNISQANNYRVYSRDSSHRLKQVPREKELWRASPSDAGHLSFSTQRDMPETWKKKGFDSDSSMDFPVTASASYESSFTKEGQVLLFRVEGKIQKWKGGELEACLVVEADGKNEALHYSASVLKESIIKADSGFVLVAQLYAGSQHRNWIREKARIKAFLWNKGGESFRVEKLRLSVVDYWPQKWGFWD